MGELASRFLYDQSRRIRAISNDPAAFDLFSESMKACLRHCQDELGKALQVVNGSPIRVAASSTDRAAKELFAVMQSDLLQQLALKAFEFGDESGEPPSPRRSAPLQQASQITKGGRPVAAFWDDLWAHIAASLHDGTLQPKTQADIEAAMSQWVTSHGHDAATSTVRGRARRLWDRISS